MNDSENSTLSPRRRESLDFSAEQLQYEASRCRPDFCESRHRRIMRSIQLATRKKTIRPFSRFTADRHRIGLITATAAVLVVVGSFTIGYKGDRSSVDADSTRTADRSPELSKDTTVADRHIPDFQSQTVSIEASKQSSCDLLSAGMHWLLHRPHDGHDSVTAWVDAAATDTKSVEQNMAVRLDGNPELPVKVRFNRIEIDLGDHTIGSLAGRFLGR